MLVPPTPNDEASRLATLRSLKVLDTAPEERFDRITRVARRLFDVPIALVSLVDASRQWFKSRQGLDATETPREISFCGHAILGSDVLVVEDASKDHRFNDNPLVTGAPGIRFYAGYPLSAPNGSKLGTLCLIDREPRRLAAADLSLLQDLGTMVEAELSAIQLATIDQLTGLSNRRGFEAIANYSLAVCRRSGSPGTLLYFDLDRFKEINDSFGHPQGDRALIEVGRLLTSNFRDADVIGRMGGDEFCVLFTATVQEVVDTALLRLEEQIRAQNDDPGQKYKLSYSVGVVAFAPERHASIAQLIEEADARMYSNKKLNQER